MSSSLQPARAIVLVDDEPLILETFGQLLRSHLSCDVHTFASPLAALQQLITINPAVIISDYSMPGMNGMKFLAQAQRFLPDTNGVIITGGPIDFDTSEVNRLPRLKGVLRKPLHWKNLAEFVLNHWPDTIRPILREPAIAC
jgi:DNA-binding NarL/FixJ family response regulator